MSHSDTTNINGEIERLSDEEGGYMDKLAFEWKMKYKGKVYGIRVGSSSDKGIIDSTGASTPRAAKDFAKLVYENIVETIESVSDDE